MMKVAVNHNTNHWILIEDHMEDHFRCEYKIKDVEHYLELNYSDLYITNDGDILQVESGSIQVELCDRTAIS